MLKHFCLHLGAPFKQTKVDLSMAEWRYANDEIEVKATQS